MSIRYCRAQTDIELQQILDLQTANLKDSVSRTETENEGFVSVVHTLDLLRDMNVKCAHIIAKDEEKVVGYALCMHPDFSESIDMLKPMFKKVRSMIPERHRFVIMGQICIDKTYRKKGIFRGLYASMKLALQGEFDSIITEVDDTNQRSLHAHLAVGFRTLETYRSGDRIWHLIQLTVDSS